MLCSDLMKRNVERCAESSFVDEAAAVMRDRNVGFLPVAGDDGVPVGVLTDRDIAVRVLADHRPPDRTRVGEIMTRAIVSCRADDDLAVAEDLMIRFKKSRVLCVDSGGRIAGVISLSDIARAESPDHAGTVAAAVAGREASASALGESPPPRKTSCRDVMNTDVQCCQRSDRAPDIAALMRDRNLGFVPVCDEGGSIVGTITDRDLAVRVVADRRFAETALAEHLLTPELVFCSPDDSLEVAEDLMAQYKKSRIVCADAARHPLGVLSLADIARVEPAPTVSRVLGEVTARAAAPPA